MRAAQLHSPLPGVTLAEQLAVAALLQAVIDNAPHARFLARCIRRVW
jgi:hypothetical protein